MGCAASTAAPERMRVLELERDLARERAKYLERELELRDKAQEMAQLRGCQVQVPVPYHKWPLV